jgi:hypothetical protein
VTGHIDSRRPELLWGRPLFGQRDTPYYFSLYPGLLVSLLAILGLYIRRRVLWPWAVVALGGVLLALGRNLPLWPALRHLPPLSGVRFPEKLILATILPWVVASAFGFDYVVMGPLRGRRMLAWGLALFALLGGLGALGILVVTRDGPLAPPARLALTDAGRLVLVAMASFALVRYLRPLGRARHALALCALLALDLTAAGRNTVHTGPRAMLFAGPRALYPLVASKREELLFNEAAWHPELNNMKGVANPPMPASWGIATTYEQDFDLTLLRWSNRATSLFWQASGDPALKTALLLRRGVTAVFRFKPGAKRVGPFVVGPEGGEPFELLRNEHAQPFVFPAERVEIVEGEAGWLAAVRRLGPEVRTAALVEQTEMAGFRGPPSPADVRIVRRTPTAMVIDVAAQGPNHTFLAINQTWDEGWRATIDGAPTRLLRCDVSLSGLVVPPGAHRIALGYEDPYISAGMWISLLASLAVLAAVVIGARRARE